jgi:iron complex outermembrane receptor protein
MHRSRFAALCAGAALVAAGASAQNNATPAPAGTAAETIEVTATRLPEDVDLVPASITVITAQQLAARNVRDLEGALALAAGVGFAPGGDGGPASSVLEFWGLREFDAYLLVVDDVPRGGAFNPDVASLDLAGVDRIEILRGAAPVMYGATSFVGVVHVIHRAAGAGEGSARLWAGNYSSGGADVWTPLPALGSFRQSISAGYEKRGYKDDRTEFSRGHVAWRGRTEIAGGAFRIDFEGNLLRQDPASPHPREGRVLSSQVPLDANHNPSDAKMDDDRFQLVLGFDRALGQGRWASTLSFAHSKRENVKGFLNGSALEGGTEDTADSFIQDVKLTDIYFDTHWSIAMGEKASFVLGLDHLYGKGTQESANGAYFVALDGSGAPASGSIRIDEFTDSEDERNFTGLYAQTEWAPIETVRVTAGLRFNRTEETKEGGVEPTGDDPGAEEEGGHEELSKSRLAGVVGVNWRAWQVDDAAIWLYADYRNTYKPAAVDFGPEGEVEILKPETAKSWEVGAKSEWLGGRLRLDLAYFTMDFDNLVISQAIDGLPALTNGGSERFKGYEVEGSFAVVEDLDWQFAYARHDSKFRDFLTEFDGVPTQLRGKRLEMAPKELYSTGLAYSPASGFNAYAFLQYTGERFLNKRNTALAADYTTYSAGIGYAFERFNVRLDGRNLSNRRDAVAESELGDAQYYRLPARSYSLSFGTKF